MEVVIMKELLGENAKYAENNRDRFKEDHVLTVNVMGAPGAGKTTFIAAAADELRKRGIESGVIEGDLYSTIDADDFNARGVKAAQINTCGECHLDAAVIREGYDKVGMKNGIVFIENVGNLICPAEFDLGENLRLITSSVPEGDDKPYKYVPMYSYVDCVVLTKCDLKDAVGFDTDYFKKGLRAVNEAPLFEVSLKPGQEAMGISAVADRIEAVFKGMK